jgi:uncharacterized repeat protein (TIGR01451 family)
MKTTFDPGARWGSLSKTKSTLSRLALVGRRILASSLLLACAVFAQSAHAARTIDSVTLNNSASGVTVVPGDYVTLVVNVTTNGNNANNDWLSTGWLISATPPGTFNCWDSANQTASGTYSANTTIQVPSTAGTYNAYFVAYNDSTCSAGASTLFTITGGVVVSSPVSAPTVVTNSATAVSTTGATLNGAVSSSGASTAVTFAYGLNNTYGSASTAAQSPLASGAANSAVSAALTGLTCGTSYHFRASAVNSAGSADGGDVAFTTSPCPLPVVMSINRAGGSPTVPNSVVAWTAVFNTPVTGVDLTDFSLVSAGGATGATLTGISGSGTAYTVTANTGTSSTGTLTLNLVDDDSILSSASVPLGGTGAANGNFPGQSYTLTSPYPTLSKVSSSASGVVGDVVTFKVTAGNTYAVPLSNVVMTDTLPAGMTYVTSVATLGTVSSVGQVVTWTVPSIPANGSAQLTLAVSLVTQGTWTNTVASPGSTSASATILVLPQAATQFRFDEPVGSWTGAVGEVIDSGGTGLQGKRVTTTAPTTTNEVAPSPTIAAQNTAVVGGFCNAGNFDGKAVVTVAANPLLQYKTQLSASAWIYPTAYPTSDLYSILSNDVNYEFHLNTSGKLYWWWQASNLTSSATIPKNSWTHVAITMDSSGAVGRERIYINGVLDSNVGSWKGTLANNACDFYIGGDISTGAACSLSAARNFRGMIDEVKLYTYELSAAEVQADMNLGRSCTGNFDHIQIEHDGAASVCTPETVVVKACLDASCSTLYPGNVTVRLAPTGWVGGDTFSFSGGITSRQLGNASAGNVTLGTVSASPLPVSNARCFIGSTESCTLNFANASCNFDAVETGAAPQARIFTKLAGTPFNLDVLALSNSTTINTTYTGTVAVDLVDTSSSACPAGSGLTPAGNITYASTDKGRKPVAFTYTQAAANVRVRMKVGTSAPACSTDNFAIRPLQFAVSTPILNNDTLTGTPKAVAGTAFTLDANAGVTAGYSGTPVLVPSKVNDHNGTAIASGVLTGVFSAGDGVQASGSAFKYLDVGNVYFTKDAVVDSVFTSVDQTTDCTFNSTSNTLVGGKFGCNIGSAAAPAKFGRWVPSHYSFTGALTPSCAAGGFTYMDQDALGASVTLKAHISTGSPASASDPVASRYTSPVANYTNLAGVTLVGDNVGTAIAVTRLDSPSMPTMPDKTGWSAGQWVLNDTYRFTKLGTPDGPFDAFILKASLVDPDGATLIGPAASQETNATKLRFGRLRLQNVYGSELLALPVPLEAQYWAGSYYATNTADGCTALPMNSLVMSSYSGGLAACETRITPSGTLTMVNGKLPAPGLVLTAPGAGNQGSVLLSPNVTATASGNTCVSSTVSAASAANMPWFSAGPSGRATFGIYKSPLIYRRENY